MKLLNERFEISYDLKRVLQTDDFKQALDEGDFDSIYKNYINIFNNVRSSSVYDFTQLMHNIGEDPLSSLDYLPSCYYYGANIEAVNIPSNIKAVKFSAFQKSKITDISFPSDLVSIDENAFDECENLTNVDFSKCSNLLMIGNDAFRFTGVIKLDFSNCTNLCSVGKGAFACCESLTNVDFGENKNLRSIGEQAFNHCTSLTTVDLSRCTKLHTIEKWSFNDTGLTSIIIPRSVASIGNSAFANCPKLKNIKIPKRFADRSHWRLGVPESCKIEYY